MTTWVKTPEVRATVEHGKGRSVVTGSVRVAFTGADTAFVDTTGAHHNDSNPAIVFRGSDYLASVHARREADGAWVATHESVSARGSFSQAPVTHKRAIADALLAALAQVDSAELRRAGAYARACQNYDRAARDVAEARTALADAEAVLAAVESAMREYAPPQAQA
jgi:hypothetical protein